MPEYRQRLVDRLITELLAELPALLVVGPRAAGKTTTAARHAATVVRLDRAAEAAAFRADPDAALRGLDEPVLVDEWQEVPEVLGAVKRAVDVDPRPGRFILAGSVSAERLDGIWGATGRLVRLPLHGMTVREQLGRVDGPALLDRLARGQAVGVPPDPPDLMGYIDLALRSGFPQAALEMSPPVRARWLESYVEQLLTRDVARVEAGRDPARLRRYFQAYALSSAGLVHDRTLFEAAGVNRRTAEVYESLLERLFIVEKLPAWTSNRLKRLILSSKRYLVDPALLTAALGIDSGAIRRNGDLLGRVIDTFVMAQLRGELATSDVRPRLHHVRTEHGRQEVDIVAEFGAESVVGFEIKAGVAPDTRDARHLAWLRDVLGDRFVCGVVFHTGPQAYDIGERIRAVPICSLWADS